MVISSFGYNENERTDPTKRGAINSVAADHWRLAAGAIGGAAGISALAVTAITCPFLVPIVISSLLVGATAVGYSVDRFFRYKDICKTEGVVFNRLSGIKSREGRCEVIATEHSSETEVWRERMIASAEHNIVISGNYCGGAALKRMMDAIERRMDEKSELKAIIISSPDFLKKEDYETFRRLEAKYPGRFSFVNSPNIWDVSQGLKKSANHTKLFVTDYGRYSIQGGTGIRECFLQPGIVGLSRSQYRGTPEIEEVSEGGGLSKILSPAFRDQDFVFQSEVGAETVGTQIYLQALLLANQMQERDERIKGKKPNPISEGEIGILSGRTSQGKATDSLVKRMLREALPERIVFIPIRDFSESERKVTDVQVQVFAQGPGHLESPFSRHLIEKIKDAKTEIFLDHMYIHPTKEIFDALVEAANRGVRITIITNGKHKKSAVSHCFFAARNKFNYNALVQATKKECRGNVKVYEFSQGKIGHHKKVALVDDTVIAGSSNLGLKSTKWSCDHESNFVAKSQLLADRVKVIFEEDIRASQEVTSFNQTIGVVLGAAFQRLLASLID